MDRMLYIAMTGATNAALGQAANTNNLANVSTAGFKADLEQFRAMPVVGGEGMPSRVYAMNERPATDFTPGAIHRTGRDLDIAVDGKGWIAVQAEDGTEAYTRAGDLRLDANGLLTTGSGLPVLGNNGGPIAVPAAEKLEIGIDGTVSIRPVGQAANVLAEVDRIKLVKPELSELSKGEDGLIRLKSGDAAEADASVRVMTGSIEQSNVNAVEAMVNMIELSRQYEMQVKMMRSAKENDEATSQMMRLA